MDNQADFLKLLFDCEFGIRAFIGSIVRDPHEREDVFQEVALTLWKEFERYDRTRPFGAWARGVAAMKLMQRGDKLKRQPVPFSPEAMQALADAFDRAEGQFNPQAAALEDCVDELPERSRKLLALRYEQSWQLNRVADELGSTLDAVYQALSRIRSKLQECIKRRMAAGGAA